MKTKKKQTESSQSKRSQFRADLLNLYHACMENAYSLAHEAKLLLEHSYYARAFFLALTAYEEIGKAQLTADYITGCVSEEEFERAFKDHDIKIAYNQRYISLSQGTKGDASLEYDLREAKDFVKARMQSLYVSKEASSPQLPSDMITKEVATEMIDGVIEVLGSIEHAEWLNQRIGSKGLFK
jgi:AbiV family abortive infection protein